MARIVVPTVYLGGGIPEINSEHPSSILFINEHRPVTKILYDFLNEKNEFGLKSMRDVEIWLKTWGLYASRRKWKFQKEGLPDAFASLSLINTETEGWQVVIAGGGQGPVVVAQVQKV